MAKISDYNDKQLLSKLTKFYLIQYEKNEAVIATKQQLNKYISNLKRCKKISNELKNIIHNSYTYVFLEEFKYETKEELNYKMNELKLLQQNRKKPIERELNDKLYKNAVVYEEDILITLKKMFPNNNIQRSKSRYSKVDFFDLTSKTFIELKTNTYSILEHKTAVINVEKLCVPFLILIFGYAEMYYDKAELKFKTKTDYYYIRYNEEVFKNYSKRYITNHLTSRSSLVVDIPTSDLKPLKSLELIDNTTTDEDFFNDLINLTN